ncbi:MAG: hypothetical protein ABSG46_13205 [Candidatus Binataceae bacterium]
MRLAIVTALIVIALMVVGSRAAFCRNDECTAQYQSDIAFCHWSDDGDQAGDELSCVQNAQDDFSTCEEDSSN